MSYQNVKSLFENYIEIYEFNSIEKKKGGGGRLIKKLSPSWGGLGISEIIKCHLSKLIKTRDA